MMRKNLQKLFSSALFLLLFAVSAMAQAPNSFNYQVVVRNASGEVIAGTEISLRLSIIKGGAFGTPVFVETHKPTTNAFGLVSLAIGSGTAVVGDINSVDWSIDVYFLKVELDATGGSTYTELGVSQILSVPYSMHAKESQILKGSITESQVSDLKNYLTAETDPVFNSSAAQGITGSNISNWNTAFGWGDHAGLYRPITYVPAWGEITSKPTTLGGYGITDAMGTSHPANAIAESNITNWNNAFGWGDHSGLYVETGQPNSISSEMIIDGTITLADLNTTSVDARYVNVNQANSVTSSMIVDGNVTTSKISNLAVNTDKIANGAVTSTKIAAGVMINKLIHKEVWITSWAANNKIAYGPTWNNERAWIETTGTANQFRFVNNVPMTMSLVYYLKGERTVVSISAGGSYTLVLSTTIPYDLEIWFGRAGCCLTPFEAPIKLSLFSNGSAAYGYLTSPHAQE